MSKLTAFALAAVAAATLPAAANAAVLYTLPAPTGAMAIPGTVTQNINASAGAGSIAFVIQSYLTVDGVNCCTDTFSVIVNGSTLFSAAYDLGGGGTDTVFVPAPAGSTITVQNGPNGTITGFIPVTFVSGGNSVSLAYAGGQQGLGDEGFGLNSLTIEGIAAATVPEPATWAMMIGGIGVAGGSLRRRRSAKPSFA